MIGQIIVDKERPEIILRTLEQDQEGAVPQKGVILIEHPKTGCAITLGKAFSDLPPASGMEITGIQVRGPRAEIFVDWLRDIINECAVYANLVEDDYVLPR
jgi:hypothetical protein